MVMKGKFFFGASGVLKKFVELGHLSLLLLYYFLFFLKAFFVVDMTFLSNFLEFWQLSFGLSIETHMKLNDQK